MPACQVPVPLSFFQLPAPFLLYFLLPFVFCSPGWITKGLPPNTKMLFAGQQQGSLSGRRLSLWGEAPPPLFSLFDETYSCPASGWMVTEW